MRARSIADFAATVRGRRQDLGLSQAALAQRTGISRKWISEFEGRKARAELLLVLRVLEALDIEIDLRASPDSRPEPASSSAGSGDETEHRTGTDAGALPVGVMDNE